MIDRRQPTGRRNNHAKGKLRKGVCENHQYENPDTGEVGDCPKCSSGELQRVNVERLSDFKCDVCGGRLKVVKASFPWIALLIAIVILCVGLLCWWFFTTDGKEPLPPPYIKVEKIVPTPNSLNLNVGDTSMINIEVIPENAYDTSMIWESSNPNVVEVLDGLILSRGEGDATITIKSNDGNADTAVFVKVKQFPILPPDPKPIPEPIPLPDVKIPENVESALNLLINRTYSTDLKLKAIPNIISKFFVPSAEVMIYGESGSAFGPENIESCLTRLALSRRIRRIDIVEETYSGGKITSIGIQEINK